ncbi:hypothetical protein N825_01200 [Skermanella stibiiresistens SB22]|uniref:Glycosyl transferase family 1 domain-containing protein n=2 Tax=Skermanella TaxID=204447 RepID=W9HFZ9_9PROT|nr:hypothetical protein N825_01200 [Skermanella stibiiresistens SB22]
MLREFMYNYGATRMSEFFAIERESVDFNVLRYDQPERYPMLRRVLDSAKSVIVHSETTAAIVRAAGFRNHVTVAPLLMYPDMVEATLRIDPLTVRAELGVKPDDILIGSFGFIGPPKRMPIVFDALKRLSRRSNRFKLLIVGEGGDVHSEINRWGVGDNVILTGFVDENGFNRLLRSIDILVNLRFPSMGETSATLIQAMSYGIPSIVSNHAWFSELPDNVVHKIGVGIGEAEELEQALLRLADDEAHRSTLGQAAREYAIKHCMPDVVAARYIDAAVQRRADANATSAGMAHRGAEMRFEGLDDGASTFMKTYFQRRIAEATPV